MPVDQDKLERSFWKLATSLKKVPKRTTPNEVHDLRTRIRRLEAILHAFMLDQEPRGQRFLKIISPIRKKAGKVRDMDVLTGFAATLANGAEECRSQLLEHLGARRLRFAGQLRNIVAQRRKNVRRRLRRYASLVGENFGDSTKNASDNLGWPADATAVALQLSAELTAWPRLKPANLHPYRLKVKQLRYVLQLAESQDDEFVDALGEVKDAIGEWHDWSELAEMAAEILDHGSGCEVLKQIRATTRAKRDHALSAAEAMRRKYLRGSRSGRNRGQRSASPKRPVLITAARLAA